MNRAFKLLVAALLVPIATLSLSACHTMGPAEKSGSDLDKRLGTDRANKDGPMENLGERVDKATGESKDNLDSPKK